MVINMQKIGVVIQAPDNGAAVVEVSRKSACEGCSQNGSCHGCTSLIGDQNMQTRAENSIGAAVGDRVLLETDSGTVILYAAAVFLLPLVLGVVGYLLGDLAFAGAGRYVCSLIGFAAAFVFLYFVLDRRARQRNDVKIIRILPAAESDKNTDSDGPADV